MRILEVKSKIKSGKEKDLAIKSLKPAVFFKDIPEFDKHLDIWNEEDIYYFLKKLFVCQVSNLNGIKSFKFQLYFLFFWILNLKKNNLSVCIKDLSLSFVMFFFSDVSILKDMYLLK